ncbi:pilus assembly protein [Bacillus sp. H-16]|uniref:TadE/TadG family type IV pilus assembly protein n=1 Tax=Alteribacter salitolerans TaxID=2912333 RepID=UPI0019667CA3|nr:TadE/TadG family type IV pilus assembly protein [Alteribacter salitolerans]MBM7095049.1 pilus assembly protein [Alteribacter salitolerans]
MRKHFKRLRKNQKGSQTLEFVAVFPLIIFAFLFIWQMALVSYAIVVTEAAARDGARAASVDGDYVQAVQSSAVGLDIVGTPGRSISESSYGQEVTVTVVTKVPMVQMPFVRNLDQNVTSTATMPYEVDEDD